jgi:hypothetical protein
MAYGITINTSKEVVDGHPNKSGKYGLVYPAPGETPYLNEKQANEVFEIAVSERRMLQDDFVATLNHYTSRGEETIRTARK